VQHLVVEKVMYSEVEMVQYLVVVKDWYLVQQMVVEMVKYSAAVMDLYLVVAKDWYLVHLLEHM
jgi:hypothetical protein